jgi:hypothetical protein
MIYLDTILLSALIPNEARTAQAMAETASALSIKQRQGALDGAGRALAERTLSGIADGGLARRPGRHP